jgi:hypothetical protein
MKARLFPSNMPVGCSCFFFYFYFFFFFFSQLLGQGGNKFKPMNTLLNVKIASVMDVAPCIHIGKS